MKAGWDIKTLGGIAEVKGGKRVPKGYRLQSEPTKHPYVTVSDFTDDGTIDSSNIRYVSGEVFEQIKRYTISASDLYLSIAGTIGKTGYVPPELDGASLTENACKLVLRPGIDRDFIYYFTKSDDFIRQAGINTRIAAQPKLALERLKTITLPVPSSLPEQQRIVGILDEAFEGIATAKANTEKNLQNARALFESHLHSIFTHRGDGWVEKTIGEVCDLRGGGTPSKVVERYWQGNIPWVSPKDMKSEIVSDSIDHISMEAIDDSATSLIPKGAILMVVRSGILARIVPIAVTGRELTINQDLKALCPKRMIESRFLYCLLESKMPILLSMVSRGATVHRLITDQIRSLTCFLPPKADQKCIIVQIDSMREETQRLESIYQQKLAELEALKKSLLHQAFTGEL